MDARALDELQALRRHDDELSEAAARLRELETQVGAVRTLAERLDAFFRAYPAEEAKRREEVEAAQATLTMRHEEARRAREDVETSRDDEERQLRELALRRANDRVAVADAALQQARAAHEELEGDAAELPTEVARLEGEARRLSTAIESLPEPSPGAPGLVEWASHTHAELFVALSQLDTERDRVIREANELASMLLGEPTYGSTVAQALRQVERSVH